MKLKLFSIFRWIVGFIVVFGVFTVSALLQYELIFPAIILSGFIIASTVTFFIVFRDIELVSEEPDAVGGTRASEEKEEVKFINTILYGIVPVKTIIEVLKTKPKYVDKIVADYTIYIITITEDGKYQANEY